MSVEIAANIMWFVWYVSWLATVVWSARTTTRMKTDRFGFHRFIVSVGCVCLFVPAGSGAPMFGSAFLGWSTQKLWYAPDWAAWGLFALIAAGFAFCWWARLHLGRLWSGFVTLKEGHRVIDTGPYGLVRHPIYSGVIFSALMTALLRADFAAPIGAALIAIGFAMTAKIEERFLREQLGAGTYDAYSRRVPMLVPMFR